MERGGQAFPLPSDAQISDQISFLKKQPSARVA
jgi:hypothetical protein